MGKAHRERVQRIESGAEELRAVSEHQLTSTEEKAILSEHPLSVLARILDEQEETIIDGEIAENANQGTIIEVPAIQPEPTNGGQKKLDPGF